MTRTAALFGALVAITAGLAGHATSPIPEAQAAAAVTVGSDSFSRSVTGGWGTADLGGPYSGDTDSSFSVNGSQGQLRLGPATSRSVISGAAPLADLEATMSVGISSLPGTGSLFMGPTIRRASDGSHVLPRIKVLTDGRVQLQLRQASSTNVLTTLGQDVQLTTKYATGDRILLRVQAAGASYRVKAWEKGVSEPTAWMIDAVSSSGPASGGVGFWAYNGSGNNTLDATLDDLKVSSLATASVNQPPTSSFTRAVNGLTVSVDGGASSDPDGTISSHAWNFGNGTSATGRTASVTYASPGTYTIRLTVTDSSGATHATSASIPVTAPGRPTAANTGVPAGTTLTRLSGNLNVTTDGTVIENKDIYGTVQIRARNVVIRN